MDTTDMPCLPMSSPDTTTPVPTASPTAKNAQGKTRATALIKLTLADVVVALELADGAIPERRRVLAAAVRSAGRLLNLPLPLIPADPKTLLPMLARLTRAGTGRSAKTIDNTRSLVKEALILVGAGRRVRCNGTPLSPAWQALYVSLPTKRLTNALSRFMHYANQHDVDPDKVNRAFLEQFVADLKASGEVANVAGRHRDVARFWNECVSSIPLWPATALVVPVVNRVRRNLPWDAFPALLSNEVERYLTWLSGADLLADDGPPRTCKPTTIRHRRELIRAAASNLVEAGFACDDLASLSVLTEPDNVKKLLRRLLEKNGRKVSAFNRGVATELIYIARHHCRRPDVDLEKIRGLRRKMGPLKAGLTKKNRGLLQQLEDEKTLLNLLGVPARLAKAARTSKVSVARRLQIMQIACAIELLLCAPVRLANLAALELGRHLPENLRRGDIHLAFAEDEVKNGRPMLLPLSESARTLLDEYLRDLRPLVASAGEKSLFVGPDGKSKSADSLRDGVIKAIKRQTGIYMTPHQFRHLAGELILRADPGQYALVQQVLGHANLKTTLGFYAADQSRAAGRVLDAIISARRRGRSPS